MENWIHVFLCLYSCTLGFTHPVVGRADSFVQRRQGLLERLTSATMLEGDIDSLGYSYRRRWQYYNACLAKNINIEAANHYFAESSEIAAEEWPVLLYLRRYFVFKDTVLSEAARKRLAKVILDYKANAPRSRSIEQFGVNGNHSIVAFSMGLDVFAARVGFPDLAFPAREAPDFRLACDSVAVDAGLAISGIDDAYTGKAPDLGAYELGQKLPIYGPRPIGMDQKESRAEVLDAGP